MHCHICNLRKAVLDVFGPWSITVELSGDDDWSVLIMILMMITLRSTILIQF